MQACTYADFRRKKPSDRAGQGLRCSDAGLVLGRGLAYCAHPAVAWRRLSRSGRILLLAAYFSASYLLTFVALLLI
jgi:hypothetical protein